MKIRVTGLDAGAHGGLTLHDEQLPLLHVPAAAVHEALHPGGQVVTALQGFLQVQAGGFRLLPAALVDEHLLGQLVRLGLIFQEIHLQVVPQEIGHGLLDELVGDGLLGLVLIGGLGREGGGNQHQAVLDVLKADFALVL